MAKPVIRQERCKGCGLCVDACPKNLMLLSSDFNAKGYNPAACADEAECVGCTLCARACPDVAIEILK